MLACPPLSARLAVRAAPALLFLAVAFHGGGSLCAAGAPEPARQLNHLAAEKSPYLRQHATNPVDWYPWGPEAFERAKREGKPIFLSIGYSTCLWCHVMERESFENEATARLLNDAFVCIKVDREERPDLDRVYQTFIQASTGSGGWPASVWLTPGLKPFFGGTYFPAEGAPGHPSLTAVAVRVRDLWTSQRERVLEQSDQMLQALAADLNAAAPAAPLAIARLRERALTDLAAAFDPEHGGFEKAPKFPNAVFLAFLLDLAATSPDASRAQAARGMALKTLRELAAGGIHDHVGGGFHRYSVDAAWRVPHFEKMLYDQAQLTSAYLEAYQLEPDAEFAAAARGTLEYVAQRMTSPEGGFYSAEDADSPAAAAGRSGEGAYYTWSTEELEKVLGPRDAALLAYAFGAQPAGNAPAGTEGFSGGNLLYRAHGDAECAARFKRPPAAVAEALAESLRRLREARAHRPAPARDDKVIAAWNGLMISAFARGAQVLREPSWCAAAERAAACLRDRLVDPATGRLARSYRAGARDPRGFAEDYAFVIQGLIDLYETDFDVRWIDWASRLQEMQLALFWDEGSGGFFANAADDASVVLRLKEDSDGAEPSANSVSLRNLLRLSELLQRPDWHERAVKLASAFGPALERAPISLPLFLASAGWLEGAPRQVLIQGNAHAPETAALVAEAWRHPGNRRVLLRVDNESRSFFEARVPFVASLPDNGRIPATAYVCENFACQLPVREPAALARQLARTGGKPPP